MFTPIVQVIEILLFKDPILVVELYKSVCSTNLDFIDLNLIFECVKRRIVPAQRHKRNTSRKVNKKEMV